MTAPTEENHTEPTKLAGNSRSDLIDLLRKSGVSLLLKVAGGLAAFAMTLVVGRCVGPAGAGQFFLCIAIVTVMGSICRLGLDQAITRFVAEAQQARDWDSINGLYASALFCVTTFSTLVSAALYHYSESICTHIFDDLDMLPVFRWMSWATIGFSLTWLTSRFFQALQEVKFFQLFQNLGTTTVFLIAIWLARFAGFDDMQAPVTFGKYFLFATTFTAIAALTAWRVKHKWFSWYGTLGIWKLLLPSLGPFFGMMLLTQLITWLPQLVLGFFRPAHEVGVYNAAFRIANLTSLVLLGVNGVVFPKFATLHATGEIERLKKLALSSTSIMALACLPFLATILFFPVHILSLVGDGFDAGAIALQIIAFGQLVNVLTGSVGGLLIMTGHEKRSLICNLFSLVVMLFLLVTLTPLLGHIGTAISQALAVTANMVCLTITCKRLLGFAPIEGIRIRRPRNRVHSLPRTRQYP